VWCGRKLGPWDQSNWGRCELSCWLFYLSLLGVSKSSSMMKRVRFDAFDDPAVSTWSSLRSQRLRKLSNFLLSNSDSRNAITLTELQSKKHSFFPFSFLSFSAADLHTVYDGYMIISSQAPSSNKSIRIQPLEASGEAIANPTRDRVRKQEGMTNME
jgi:hypothetical protein